MTRTLFLPLVLVLVLVLPSLLNLLPSYIPPLPHSFQSSSSVSAVSTDLAATKLTPALPDFAGGTNFVIVAVLTLGLSATHTARQVVASLLLAVWALRLSGFLLFRILKTGADRRFDDMRGQFWSFLGFWVFQMVWVWTVGLPVTILNSPNMTRHDMPTFGTAADILGVIMWTVGFLLESMSDVQKYRFRSANASKGATCDVGLFAWSRHPNYFGEMLVQFAVFTLAISPSAYGDVPSGSGAYAAQYASIVGPLFLTGLLLFVSGLTLQERPGAAQKFGVDGPDGPTWLRHKAWLDHTSILLPMPPAVWRRLPIAVKRTVGAEWPLYVFDPAKHAKPTQRDDRQEGRHVERHDGRNGRV
jgi:steroid 5-alpha reductase family enzyme